MGKIAVDGVGTFDVDDSFGKLTPEQQQAEVASMVGLVRGHSQGQAAAAAPAPTDADNAHTLAEMGSPEGMIGAPALGGPTLGTAAPSDNASTPIIGPIRRGVASIVNGIGHTVGLFAPQTGAAISGSANQADLMAPSSVAAEAQAFKNRDVGGIISNLPSAVLEGVPQLAGAAAAGIGGAAAGGAVAGPAGATVGGLSALGAYGAATQGGDLARARAAYNNRSEPSASDAAIGVLGAAGLNMLPGGAGPLGGLERATGSALKGVAQHAAVDAGQAVGQQAVATAGTAQGGPLGSYDPSTIASQAALGAGTRVGLGGARSVGDQLSGRAAADTTAAQAAQWNSLTSDEQRELENQVAAAKAVTDVQDSATGPTDVGPSVAARTALSGLKAQAGQLVASRVNDGLLDSDGAKVAQQFLADAASTQRRLTPDRYDEVAGLGLSDPDTTLLQDAGHQMDLLSDAGVMRRGSSALGDLGGVVGRAFGLAAGAKVGHPVLGLEAGAKVGSNIGGALAAKLGLTSPVLLKSASDAADMMQAAGVPLPDTKAAMLSAIGQRQNAMATQAQMMGLDPSSYTPGPAQATAQARAMVDPQVMGATVGADPLAAAQARAQAQTGLRALAPVVDPTQPVGSQGGPQATQGAPAAPDVVLAAAARAQAATASQDPRTGSTPLLSAVMPVPPSTTADWLAQGQSIPRAQYAAGEDLSNRIQRAGTPKPINPAQEYQTAVRQLESKGAFDKNFADALLQHRGSVVYGIHKMIVNQMLMNHGLDMRTSDAQAAMPGMQPPAAPPAALAAE